jgi:hypothetical protein
MATTTEREEGQISPPVSPQAQARNLADASPPPSRVSLASRPHRSFNRSRFPSQQKFKKLTSATWECYLKYHVSCASRIALPPFGNSGDTVLNDEAFPSGRVSAASGLYRGLVQAWPETPPKHPSRGAIKGALEPDISIVLKHSSCFFLDVGKVFG